MSADHSGILNNKTKFEANNSIDLDLMTASKIAPGSDGRSWFRVTLDQVHCIDQVVCYNRDGSVRTTWNCSNKECSCEGEGCSLFSLYVQGAAPVPLVPDTSCKHGHIIGLQERGGNSFFVCEMAVIATGKLG